MRARAEVRLAGRRSLEQADRRFAAMPVAPDSSKTNYTMRPEPGVSALGDDRYRRLEPLRRSALKVTA
jgi:hypothetical protein